MENLLATDLHIDHNITTHLKETAGWAKFLGVCGMIFSGIAVVFSFTMGGRIESALNTGFLNSGKPGFLLVFVILFFAVGCFILSLFLYRFAAKIQAAILATDKYEFVASIRNLRNIYAAISVLFGLYVLLFVLNIIKEFI